MIEVLLVEDDALDADLILRSFDDVGSDKHFAHVVDGRAAVNYLYRHAPYEDSIRPNLILLDLNLPKLNGWEVLEIIKSDPHLADIPVIILTSSDRIDDIKKAYNLHANAYLVKQINMLAFAETAEIVERFWFNAVKLPDDN